MVFVDRMSLEVAEIQFSMPGTDAATFRIDRID